MTVQPGSSPHARAGTPDNPARSSTAAATTGLPPTVAANQFPVFADEPVTVHPCPNRVSSWGADYYLAHHPDRGWSLAYRNLTRTRAHGGSAYVSYATIVNGTLDFREHPATVDDVHWWPDLVSLFEALCGGDAGPIPIAGILAILTATDPDTAASLTTLIALQNPDLAQLVLECTSFRTTEVPG